MNSEHFTVIGEGNIGDKAEQLMLKTQAWLDAGGYVPHRTVLAQSIVEDFLRRAGLGNSLEEAVHAFKTSRDTGSLDARIRNGSLSMEDLPGLNLQPEHLGYGKDGKITDTDIDRKGEINDKDDIFNFFDTTREEREEENRLKIEEKERDIRKYEIFLREKRPFVVRSSGRESSGIGVYETEFCLQNNLLNAVKAVIASYFTENAILHREKAKQEEEEFAVMIEPLIGSLITTTNFRNHTLKLFMPTISGYGYTSTSKGEGYVNIVPGIGGGVQNRRGLFLKRETLRKYKSRKIPTRRGVEEVNIDFAGLMIQLARDYNLVYGGGNRAPAIMGNIQGSTQLFNYETLEFYKDNIGSLLKNNMSELNVVDLLKFFERLDRIEMKHGPQYFEFCVTTSDDSYRIWLNQVNDKKIRTDSYEISLEDNVLLTAVNTQGKEPGKHITKIVKMGETASVFDLRRFNEENNDYILIYDSNLVKTQSSLPLRYWSNCAAIIEEPNRDHGMKSSISHLTNQADELKVLFGIVSSHITSPAYNMKFMNHGSTEHGLRVYNGNFKVVCSEQQDWLQVIELK